MNTDNDLQSILNGCRRQEPKAQRQLYGLFVLKLYNVSFRILRNKEDVEDCLQQAFTKIFKNILQYDENKGKVGTWMNRVVINQSLTKLKSKKKFIVEINDLVVVNDEPNSLDHLETGYIYDAIMELPDQLRVVFNLYEIEGYKHKDIAQMLGINESASRTYLTRAKAKLRAILSSQKNTKSGAK